MRLVNILVIAALILAASFVYKIKFDSTLQAERVAKLRGELRRERNAIAVLRAEWARLDPVLRRRRVRRPGPGAARPAARRRRPRPASGVVSCSYPHADAQGERRRLGEVR